MRMFVLICAAALWTSAARACELALLLTVDVSGSIDPREYRVQMDGLAAGLRDGIVVDSLIRQNASVALMQWTGEGRQHMSVPWVSVRNAAQAEQLAQQVEEMPRQWDKFSTAIGDALLASARALEDVPQCKRKVVDVSGDGESNEGADVAAGRAALDDMGATVNAVVIETSDADLTAYFWENVITGSGAFVVTAAGFEDYPKRIREKLIREVAKQLAALPESRDAL